ncbi:hypothetical protein PG985_007630 [Apiospora marii]|uniref:uncharacterized protein n=1 Tax=Apiospora marii TaxID=335849 RepID=UPI00312D5FCC
MSLWRSQMNPDDPDPMSVDSPPDDPNVDLSPYNSSGMNDPNPSTPGSSRKSSKRSTDAGSTIPEDRVNDVRTYFANAGLRFRRNIATGNHGGTMLFDKFEEEEDGGMRLQKSVVVKYALDTADDASTNNDADLGNEMFWLEQFVNAEHIIQVDPDSRQLWRGGGDQQSGGGAAAGEVLRRPVIVMEYMEHGTLSQLKHRFRDAGRRIPDRMTTRETLPDYEDEKPAPSTLSQYSMKGLNVLVADLVPGDGEQELVPLLKLIDFGRGEEVDPADSRFGPQAGVAANLAGVAYILTDLLRPYAQDQGGWVRWDVAANAVYDECRIRTAAEEGLLLDTTIHRLLRDTIAFFCATLPKQLPDLYAALDLVEAGLAEIRRSTNPINSDAAIRDLVQRLVFDADYDPEAPFLFDFEDQWDEFDPWREGEENEGEEGGEGMEGMEEDGGDDGDDNNEAGPSGGAAGDQGNTGGGGTGTMAVAVLRRNPALKQDFTLSAALHLLLTLSIYSLTSLRPSPIRSHFTLLYAAMAGTQQEFASHDSKERQELSEDGSIHGESCDETTTEEENSDDEDSDIRYQLRHHFGVDFPCTNLRAIQISPHPGQDSSSLDCFNLARLWLQDCEANHKLCKLSSESNLPKRFLAISKGAAQPEIRLVTDSCLQGRYAALSHCWGKLNFLCLTTDNLDRFGQNIPWRFLPKTFQDAIKVCLEMGLFNIWIDSLCILQDSREDWEDQSACMAVIYRNATIVIAANSASGAHEGFLGIRKGLFVECITPPSLESPGLYARPKFRHYSDYNMSDETLEERGWAYQERLLARRYLSFNKRELHWECESFWHCECGESEWCDNGIHEFSLQNLDISETGKSEVYQIWYNTVVSRYSGRLLTVASDKLPALSAVTQVFQKKLQDTFLAGFWKGDLINGLCWTLHIDAEPSLSSGLAPTWSWCSIQGQSFYREKTSIRVHHSHPLRAECLLSGTNAFGQVEEGFVTLCGPLVKAFTRLPRSTRTLFIWTDSDQSECVSLFMPDCHLWIKPQAGNDSAEGNLARTAGQSVDQDGQQSSSNRTHGLARLWCLHIGAGRQTHGKSALSSYALVLGPSPKNPEHFIRLGISFTDDGEHSDLFANAMITDVTIE